MTPQHCPRVSLIATVRNEIHSLDGWLAGVAAQARMPDEIVIVDGGSTDGTWERLAAWSSRLPMTLIQQQGANIAAGRNRAIAEAIGELIVITDAGTRAEPDWIEQLVESFALDVDVVCGFFVPDGMSLWERTLAATTLPDAEEIDARRFLPSSRSVAFRRAWWEAGIRYPEWLDYCEDLVWDLSLKRAGARFTVGQSAVVRFRVRPSARAFFRQYFLYARGDGKAGLFPRRHAIRYATWAGLITVLARRRPFELFVTGILGLAYCATPARRLWRRDRQAGLLAGSTVRALPLIPVQRAIGDIAKMCGYPFGLIWRWRTFGALGWKANWRRISPDGRLAPRGHTARGNPAQPSSPAGESRVERR